MKQGLSRTSLSARSLETPDQVMSKFWAGIDSNSLDFNSFYESIFGKPSPEIENKIKEQGDVELKEMDKDTIAKLIMAPPPNYKCEDKPVFSHDIWMGPVKVAAKMEECLN